MNRRVLAAASAVTLAACSGPAADRQSADAVASPVVASFKDGLLYAAIKAKLAGADLDSTTRVSVIVAGGVATLRGSVPDGAAKIRDLRLVREVRGVTGVTDELIISKRGRSFSAAMNDAVLAAAVESSLAAQTGINVTGVHVGVNAGTVTLRGHAPSAAIVATLVAAAKKTPGVRNVVARLAVR